MSFRHPNPKKRLSHTVIHRYHSYYKGNGFINKMLITEKPGSRYSYRAFSTGASFSRRRRASATCG